MIISQRQKHRGSRTSIKTKKKLPINFDLASLNLMCEYVLSDNRNIKRGQYINLRNLIDMLEIDKYVNDQEKYKRIIFIKKGIEARLLKGLDNSVTIIKYINGGIIDDDIIDINNFVGMSNNEIDWINETVSNALSSSFIYEEVDNYIDLFTRFKAADYTSISDLTNEIKSAVVNLNNRFRKCKIESSQDRIFSLKKDNFRSVIQDTYNEITCKYRHLVTGMQGFNQLIGGGFENTRLYLLLGVTGAGKSLSLLNIAYQIKKYNKGFKPKDPTKIPCVVYLTMENSVTETIERLFEICIGDSMKNHTVDEIERLLRTEGELYLADESPIDLIIKFRPNRSEDTSYLYTLTEDLEDEGYEVICMIQDHIKRIRSVEPYQQDKRNELGDVTNEMKTFAVIKDIPVITDSHLNRDGARVIDSSSSNSKSDLTRQLGKSNVGESLLMLDNTDLGIIINKEYDYEGNLYMVFKNIKTRVKIMREYICQPFVPGNDIRLMEDYFSPVPVFRESLSPVSPNKSNNTIVNTNIQNSSYSKLQSLDEDNIYEYSSRYSSIDLEDLEPNKVENIIPNMIRPVSIIMPSKNPNNTHMN